jgi:FkbM family methyltransferase
MGVKESVLFQKLRFRARAMKYARKVDPCEIRFLRTLLRPGDLAIDVGAHKGGYLFWLQKAVSGSGKVLAFEPQKGAAAYLNYIKDIFGFDQVEILNCAVSNAEGVRSLFVPSQRVSTGATLVEGLFPENDAVDRIEAVTLDRYLGKRADLPPPRYIKIDVETHEFEVLQGARAILGTARPVVQFEADQHVYAERPIARLFEFLQGLGLDGFFFFNRRLHPLREFDAATHQPAAWRATPNYHGFANNFIFLDRKKDRPILQRYGIED